VVILELGFFKVERVKVMFDGVYDIFLAASVTVIVLVLVFTVHVRFYYDTP
jgi:hypothetical protein